MGDRNAKYRGGSREGRDDSWMFNRSSGGGRGRNRKMDRWKRNVSNTYQSMLERRSCQFFSQLLTCPLGLLVFITVSFLIYLLPFLEGGSLPFWIIQAVVCLLVSMIWIVCTAIIGFLYPWGPGGCCSISCAVPAGFFTGTIAGFWNLNTGAGSTMPFWYAFIIIAAVTFVFAVFELAVMLVTVGFYEPFVAVRCRVNDWLTSGSPCSDLPEPLQPPGSDDL